MPARADNGFDAVRKVTSKAGSPSASMNSLKTDDLDREAV